MPASINQSHSLPPSSVSGATGAAPHIRQSRPPEDRSMRLVGSDPSRRQSPQQPQPDASTNPAADAYATITDAAKSFQGHLDAVAANRSRLTEDGQRAHIAAFADSQAAKAVDLAVKSVHQFRDAKAAERDRIKAGLSPKGDAAAESRAQLPGRQAAQQVARSPTQQRQRSTRPLAECS
jgi:hypothetical protein